MGFSPLILPKALKASMETQMPSCRAEALASLQPAHPHSASGLDLNHVLSKGHAAMWVSPPILPPEGGAVRALSLLVTMRQHRAPRSPKSST